jgi:hypothetical protein
VAEVCLRLLTSEPRPTNPCDTSSAGELNAIKRPYRLMGHETGGEVCEVLALCVTAECLKHLVFHS